MVSHTTHDTLTPPGGSHATRNEGLALSVDAQAAPRWFVYGAQKPDLAACWTLNQNGDTTYRASERGPDTSDGGVGSVSCAS